MHAPTLKHGDEKREYPEFFETSRGDKVRRPEGAQVVDRLSAYAVIRDHAGKLFAFRKHQNGYWELPGGKIEKGDKNQRDPLRHALKRECLEEIGVPIRVGELEEFSEYPIGKGWLYSEKEDTFYESTQYFFKAFLDTTQPNNPNPEMYEFKFFEPTELGEQKWKKVFLPVLEAIRNRCIT